MVGLLMIVFMCHWSRMFANPYSPVFQGCAIRKENLGDENGHNQRCIQQAMAFDTNIRAVQEAVCALLLTYHHPLQARRIGVNKCSKHGLNEAATRSP